MSVGSQTELPECERVTKAALIRIALYYGIAGFGGGYSVLAQLRRDLVERRRWLDAEEFLVLAELSKSLPGTPATSLLALLGQRVGGISGGVVSAIAFLLPSAVLMTLFGAFYAFLRPLGALTLFFDGMNAAMAGVVAAVTLDLARAALKTRTSALAAIVLAVALVFRIVSEPVLAAIAVAFGAARAAIAKRKDAPEPAPSSSSRFRSPVWLPLASFVGSLGVLAALARVFVPIGVLTFGGGLAMIPAIEHTVVAEQHWLGPKSFADAIALGQITPGPVAICSTFIGYRVAGVLGALVATVAMFGPAIALALAVGRSIDRFRSSRLVEGALQALGPAVIAMLLAATFSLARAGMEDFVDGAVAVASFIVLVGFDVNPLWTLIGGGLVHIGAVRIFGAA